MYEIHTHPIDTEIIDIQQDKEQRPEKHNENGFSEVNEIEGADRDEFCGILGTLHSVPGHRCANGLRRDFETFIAIVIT